MHLRTSSLRVPLAIASVLLMGGLTACSSDSSSSSDTTKPADSSSADEYVVVAKDFSLTNLTVEAGEKFTFDNQGATTHTLTADDGSFDAGRIDAGKQSSPLTAPSKAGKYGYHCAIHASMTGTLTVT